MAPVLVSMPAGPRLGTLLVLFWLWLAPAAWAEVAVPALKARVTDLTGTLSADQQGRLENRLKEIEGKSGSQMAVLLVPTTQPETIEQYSIRVAEAWKLGKKGVDNGVLVLVAKNDRKVRIEVGYGLEGAIPDASAKRVIAEDITPRFKAGDFAGGLEAGINQLAGLVDNETGTAAPASYSCAAPDESETSQAPPAASPPEELTFWDRVAEYLRDMPVWILVVLVIVGTLLRSAVGPFFGGLTMGSVVGAGAWFAWGTVEAALFGGIVAFVFVLVGLENWISMAFEGSSGSSSGSSSSFSGGGGSFGGGGASGSW